MFEIDDHQLDELEHFFDEQVDSEDVLDFAGVHGVLCALAIRHGEYNATLAEDIIVGEGDIELSESIKIGLSALFNHINTELYSEDQVELPFELQTLDDDNGEAWAVGFMEAVFSQEETWFDKDEEDVSALLMPIEVTSGLFAEEPEFKDIYTNPKLLNNLRQQIPEVLTDLYLLFQSPE